MSINTGEPTTETVVTNEMPDGNDDYVPTFNAATRKWAYLISGLVGIAGAVLSFVSAVPDVRHGWLCWVALALWSAPVWRECSASTMQASLSDIL
jgi:hypothetical protein